MFLCVCVGGWPEAPRKKENEHEEQWLNGSHSLKINLLNYKI